MRTPRRISSFGTLVQRFFCERLVQQKNASAHTVAAYRDTFRLLLPFLAQRSRKTPDSLAADDLDAPAHLGVPESLGKAAPQLDPNAERSIGGHPLVPQVRRSLRTGDLGPRSRVLAIPMKRFGRPLLGYLSEEMNAVLDAPDLNTWSGHRDRTMFALMYNTGARVSELVSLRVADASLGTPAVVRIQGKGRKERSIPLWKNTKARLKEWLRRINVDPASPLFPNARSGIVPLRCRTSAAQSDVQGEIAMPEPCQAAGLATYISPHHGDAPAGIGIRHNGRRFMAWTREYDDDPSLCRGQREDERKGAWQSSKPYRRNQFGSRRPDSLLRFLNTL